MENPEFWDDRAKLLFDLQVLAFQADVTRVVTMLMGRELSGQTFPQIGVPEQHHTLSHHMNNPNLMARKAKIDAHYIAQFGYFLEKLRATPDGDGSLLDHSLLLYGGGHGNPNLHEHTNLPCLLAGGGAGTVKSGRHRAVRAADADGESAPERPGQAGDSDAREGRRQHGTSVGPISYSTCKSEI